MRWLSELSLCGMFFCKRFLERFNCFKVLCNDLILCGIFFVNKFFERLRMVKVVKFVMDGEILFLRF